MSPQTHLTCPECNHRDCYTEWPDGGGFCHSCGYRKKKGKVEVDFSELKQVHKAYRGIDKDVVEKYNITTGVTKEGTEVCRTYNYPHRPKIRILPKDFSHNKGFTNDHLFGENLFNAGSSRIITVVEGEDDAPATFQILGKKYPVVAIPGAASPVKNFYEYLNSFQTIVLAFDNDAAGEKGAQRFAEAFPNKVYRVKLTLPGLKDACDYLAAGKESDFLYAWINRTKYVPEFDINTPDQFLKILDEGNDWVYLPTGIVEYDSVALGLMQGGLTVFTAPEGIGKQLPNTTPIPTPTGFKLMGDLKIGDKVFGDDGKETSVTFITETQYGVPCYEITFADGSKQVAGGPHRWGIYTTDNTYKVMTTEEMFTNGVLRGAGVAKYSVPINKPVEYVEADLPIDPYVFGMWLGDGHSYSRSIYVGKEDAEQFKALVEIEREKEDKTCMNYWVKGLSYPDLSKLDVLGNKHIPQNYLTASVKQRLALLQGMMDSDGTVSGVGCEFYSTKEYLAEGFMQLARSLGYKCRMTEKKATLYGKHCGSVYRVWFLAHGDFEIFRYKRKQEKVVYCNTHRATRKTIRSIEPVESVPSRCLTVDNASHLFLCGVHYTVTHNTEFMRMLEYQLIAEYPEVPFAYCHMEETNMRSILGLASYKLGKNVTRRSLIEDMGEVRQAITEITANENIHQFHIGVDEDPMIILERIKYYANVCGCKYIFFEPIQDLAHQRSEPGESAEQFLSKLSVQLSRVAAETGVGIITIAHQNDQGEIRDCRLIGKQAAVRVDLTRNLLSLDEDDRNTTTLTIVKNRPVGPTGYAGQLKFDLDSFTLREKVY